MAFVDFMIGEHHDHRSFLGQARGPRHVAGQLSSVPKAEAFPMAGLYKPNP